MRDPERAASAMASDATDDETPVCRYCFESADEGDGGEMLRDICACAGGQRYVHLSCLRRWQRMVLVSQPTHPAFHEDDVRHHECNVCGSKFNISPPTRHELMATFTGAEIAALIDEGCVIGSHPGFDDELASQLRRMDPYRRSFTGYQHWIGGVYLITGVEADDGREEITLRNVDSLKAVKERVERSVVEGAESGSGSGVVRLEIVLGSKRLRLVPGGSLANVAPEDLPRAFDALDKTPVTLFFARGEGAPDCGEDHVAAVNLTRPFLRVGPDESETEEQPKPTRLPRRKSKNKRRKRGDEGGDGNDAPSGSRDIAPDANDDDEDDEDDDEDDGDYQYDQDDVQRELLARVVQLQPLLRSAREATSRAIGALRARYPAVSGVEVTHFLGGPCESDALMACVVPGGVRRGWTVVHAKSADPGNPDGAAAHAALVRAIELAHGRAARRDGAAQGDVSGGQTVELRGLRARPELNGEIGLALRFDPTSGRWLARLRNGDGVKVKPENLAPVPAWEGSDGEEGFEGSGAGGRVLAFWGDARWSRAQLLGEIARGHWGLCRASVAEMTTRFDKRHATLCAADRLAFAPVTEMTEDFMREQAREMRRVRDRGVVQAEDIGEGAQRDEERG